MTPFETLKSLRAGYPTPMSREQLGELLNGTAWMHRAEGWGVLSKPNGSNCPQPQTGQLISTDILFHLPTLIIYDVLIDADGQAKPTWNDAGSMEAGRFVKPVDAAVPQPGPTPPPSNQIPYNESYAIEFGQACNQVYLESGAPIDPGMISVQSSRAAWDYYVGGLAWPESKHKHVNELRAVYGLPPV